MSMPKEPEMRPKAGMGQYHALTRGLGPLLFVLIVLGASLYAFGDLGNIPGKFFGGKSANSVAQCAAAQARVAMLKPLVKGEIAALQVAAKPAPLVPLSFLNAKGEPVTLASFRGKTILLNLWATWCVPCRKEMPMLDALQAELGSKDFEVVAVNIDTRNPDKPKAFLDEIKVSRLRYYSDPSAKIFQELKAAGKAFGMPTTLLIDPEGCELANLSGPAEWASAEAIAFVKAAISR